MTNHLRQIAHGRLFIFVGMAKRCSGNTIPRDRGSGPSGGLLQVSRPGARFGERLSLARVCACRQTVRQRCELEQAVHVALVVPIVGLRVIRLVAKASTGEKPLALHPDLLDQPLDVLRRWGDVEEPEVPVRAAVVDAVKVHDVEVQVQFERRAEPLDRRDGARLPGPSTSLRPVEPRDAPERDLQHTLSEILTPSEEPAASPRYRQDPLARRRPGDHPVNPVRRLLGHPSPEAARAEASRLAREEHAAVVLAILALEPGEALGWVPAAKVGLELTLDKPGQLPVLPRQLADEQRNGL